MTFKMQGTGMDLRTENRLFKKMGRPRVLATQGEANQMAQLCLRSRTGVN